MPPATYDAVYCSHNLEHFHRRDAAKVVRGFRHVLKPEGFVHALVPDLGALFQLVVREKLDVDDQLYVSTAGPIRVRDVIYGFSPMVESSGNDFYLHKTGYTAKSLAALFTANGFPHAFVGSADPVQLIGMFFIQAPNAQTRAMFGPAGHGSRSGKRDFARLEAGM